MELTLDKHVHQGGTFITNFRKDMWPVYRDAVRIYGEMSTGFMPRFQERRLVLVDTPAKPAPRDYGGALHVVDAGGSDLSNFWLVFDIVARAKGAR